MKQSLFQTLQAWNKTYSEHTKLQHAYIVMAILVLIAAGIVGLINYNLGQSLLFVTCVLVVIFIANGVAWALLKVFVSLPLEAKPPKNTKK